MDEKQRFLAEVVSRTVAESYAAKRERDLAIAERKDLAPYNLALEEARRLEREAVYALDLHKAASNLAKLKLSHYPNHRRGSALRSV